MANYNSTYTGAQVDNAVGRALPDGTLDIDIAGKQDKLSQAQLNATNSGINAEKVAKYDGYEQEIDNKQDNLPDIVNDRYLHTNALTGELEWKVGISKGTDDYNELLNKPKINGEEIVGEISLEDLNVQEKLNDSQLDVVNSGVTSEWKNTIDGDITSLEVGKQDALSQAQLEAVNSEVTSEWKQTIDGDITSLEVGKQDALSQEQLSKINRALVTPVATENTKRIVAVDEQNNQVQFRVGNGLVVNGLTSPFTIEAVGGGEESKLVEVTYGVTTYNEVTALLNQGKIPFVKASDVILYYNTDIVTNQHRFGNNYGTALYACSVNNLNTWSFSTGTAESSSNKEPTTLTPSSPTKYPSSKAVADYVTQHGGGGWALLWENASPSSQFVRQTLNINSANYSKIAISLYGDTTTIIDKSALSNNQFGKLLSFSNEEIDTAEIIGRSFKVSDSSIELYNSYRTFIETIDGVVQVRRVIANSTNVPYKIYGFN